MGLRDRRHVGDCGGRCAEADAAEAGRYDVEKSTDVFGFYFYFLNAVYGVYTITSKSS